MSFKLERLMKPGNTKLVRLENIEKEYNLNNFLYAKVENSNPSGSIKDRAVYQMLIDLKESGKLNENTTIIEATSGNTGISLGYYKKEFGYNLIIVMPESMSVERRNLISSFGAELYLTKGGMEESEKVAIELVNKTAHSILFDQFNNPSNSKAHYLTTGPEILTQLPAIDYLFAGIGTGGTISGTSKYLKEHSNCHVVGIEPLESPLLTKGCCGSHLIQGIGANFIPSILDRKVIDEIVDVNGKNAISAAKTIRNLEQIDIGISSGAALEGCINYLKQNKITGKNIVIIFPDKGDRYTW